MQTAKPDVRNVGSTFKQTTRVLFNSGYQRTYISHRLANKLKLKDEKEEEINIVTLEVKIQQMWKLVALN